jgi:hypothetical protein
MRYVFVKTLKDLCPKWDEFTSLDTHFWRLHVLQVKFGHHKYCKISQSLVSRSTWEHGSTAGINASHCLPLGPTYQPCWSRYLSQCFAEGKYVLSIFMGSLALSYLSTKNGRTFYSWQQ